MIELICVDFQREYTRENGKEYKLRPSVEFVNSTLIPFLRDKKIKVSEIISDYRQPRPGDTGDLCHPGSAGYESDLPGDVKDSYSWVKCMNSPIWVRDNTGMPTDADREPGLPYQDPEAFDSWLRMTIGLPYRLDFVVLFGLTLDCCVLCTAQELKFRGYDVRILFEGTDVYSGNQLKKHELAFHQPLSNWADIVTWKDLKNKL
tara:strand:- start:657 stop:1268 length:612 start_codon:yes stop_codon:yes gene_type:complete